MRQHLVRALCADWDWILISVPVLKSLSFYAVWPWVRRQKRLMLAKVSSAVLVQRNGARAAAAARTRFFMILSISRSADLAGLVDRVTVVRCDSHLDVVATSTRRSLRRRERREPLTTTPLVGALENAIADCKSDGRPNQQQHRCSEEQKAFHDILPAFSKDLELATDAAASCPFEQRPLS